MIFFFLGKMNNEITQRSHERCHLFGTPPFLPQSHLGSIGYSILVVIRPKVNRWNKERKGCPNNLKNMLEAFVTMVHKNYLLKIAFPFHFSFSLFFLFYFFFLFQFLLHFSLLLLLFFFPRVHLCATKRWEEWAKVTRCNVFSKQWSPYSKIRHCWEFFA